MLRLQVVLIFTFLLLIQSFNQFSLLGSENDIGFFTFIGSKGCKECHGDDVIGNQYKIWLLSPHAKAYNILISEKAAEIAKKVEVTSPEKDYACLKCHATGKGKVNTVVKEGVGCEACHGPGSEYYKASNHVDYSSRENGYRRGIKYGMYPILGIASLKTRERLCLSCHRKERPCFPEGKPNDYEFRINPRRSRLRFVPYPPLFGTSS